MKSNSKFFSMHCVSSIFASFAFCLEHTKIIFDFMPDIFAINTIVFFAIALWTLSPQAVQGYRLWCHVHCMFQKPLQERNQGNQVLRLWCLVVEHLG